VVAPMLWLSRGPGYAPGMAGVPLCCGGEWPCALSCAFSRSGAALCWPRSCDSASGPGALLLHQIGSVLPGGSGQHCQQW